MASKTGRLPASVHSAGIYADMTVDGPEIGDLVVIIDKAKNLPNRKSMGKQDPYCAARLGKEAKKTSTDKRGGQTPRWDQELRFTVHDSPDYYQLKVSVFNDDKKTDLIGETWINLKEVVIPGGGQNDLWHNLNCKGKYAGEIRIELTYYDTRPKEETPADRSRESFRQGMEESPREAIGGPRQAKPMKRRPLPGRPGSVSSLNYPLAEHPQSAPPMQTHQPHTPPRAFRDQRDPAGRHSLYSTPTHTPPHIQHRYSQQLPQGSPYDNGSPYQSLPPGKGAIEPELPQYHQSGDLNPVEFAGEDIYYPSQLDDRTDPFLGDDASYAASERPLPPSHGSRNPSPGLPPAMPHGDHSMHHSHSAPPGLLPQQPNLPMYNAYSENSQPLDDQFPHALETLPDLSFEQRHHSYDASYSHMQPTVEDEDGPPPPPPVHRQSGHHVAVYDGGTSGGYSQNMTPPPLNISGLHRPSPQYPTPSPLNTSNSNSPTTVRGNLQSNQQIAQRASFHQGERRRSGDAMMVSPVRPGSSNMPASLVPGYNPLAAEQVVDPQIYNKRQSMAGQGNFPQESSPQVMERYPLAPTRELSNRAQITQDGQNLGSSATIAKSQATTPDPRIVARKSISPAPFTPPGERRLSGVPFSPDSYDSLNPNAVSSPVDAPKSRYETPEQAKEAFRQRRREAEQTTPDGSIITSDGHVVDPSDHLPASTWAPEPDTKYPKKATPQSERARPAPNGAQPMPPSVRRGYRESQPPTPIYAHSTSEPQTPNSGRNRLQKKSKPGQGSSPIAASSPLANYGPKGTPGSPSDYPLRERQNYGYNSPSYGSGPRNSPAGPPPVPAKVPLGPMDGFEKLSEEMKRIDLGSGRRRVRY
ncbi:MAG: hypothetical protein M1824_005422 [Vezdaea acicularis]|nr:MAG: hypothetical protein M1824_005422 [Vezdaea acicularis]